MHLANRRRLTAGHAGTVMIVQACASRGPCPVVAAGLVHNGFAVLGARSIEDAAAHLQAPANGVFATIGCACFRSDFTPHDCASLRAVSRSPIIAIVPAGRAAEPSLSHGAEVVPWTGSAVDSLVERLRMLQPVAATADRGRALDGPHGLHVDVEARRVQVGGEVLPTSRLEFDLLAYLLKSRGCVIPANELAEAVWGYRGGGSTNYIETRVSRLRSKLRGFGLAGIIETVRGVGYVIR